MKTNFFKHCLMGVSVFCLAPFAAFAMQSQSSGVLQKPLFLASTGPSSATLQGGYSHQQAPEQQLRQQARTSAKGASVDLQNTLSAYHGMYCQGTNIKANLQEAIRANLAQEGHNFIERFCAGYNAAGDTLVDSINQTHEFKTVSDSSAFAHLLDKKAAALQKGNQRFADAYQAAYDREQAKGFKVVRKDEAAFRDSVDPLKDELYDKKQPRVSDIAKHIVLQAKDAQLFNQCLVAPNTFEATLTGEGVEGMREWAGKGKSGTKSHAACIKSEMIDDYAISTCNITKTIPDGNRFKAVPIATHAVFTYFSPKQSNEPDAGSQRVFRVYCDPSVAWNEPREVDRKMIVKGVLDAYTLELK